MSDAAVRRSLSLLSDFKALQEERVLQYKILNDAHKVFLSETNYGFELAFLLLSLYAGVLEEWPKV
jgi:hypothetical protein